MKIAKTDITYCLAKDCKHECYRKMELYLFNPEIMERYSFMEKCEIYKKNEGNFMKDYE